ncbi:MAG: two-component system, response regulator, stage 0 sporulation protein [Bacillota bacterium]|jgi:two-component system response regulator (stage 0 sporulation protein F)|nr:two-component system, response regulator, stage 0 sporulation protein [Bacillota bacterium]MDK2855441.1 two-component system, response regulator, stage 0 sporulation protein [Bacillota bacterium]MDK2925342.1 two-component system, response regulator, stage 0 sporulation protein [Bacillota bacterium]
MPTLLVVDDQPGIRHLLIEVFRDQGVSVITAGTGSEALVCLKAERPDVLLLDVKLPGGDGFFVLHEARKLFPHLPVILMTGYREGELACEAVARQESGVVAVLRKPFDIFEARRLVLKLCLAPLAQEA